MLIDGLSARCQPLPRGQVNYLKFGAQKLVRYELDPEIAKVLGIPSNGTVGDVGATVTRQAVETAMDAYDSHCPFILPMSAKIGKFIIAGIPISA